MINWFPGHMAKANRDIAKMQRLADLFIIVLDARAPVSTYNDTLDKLAPNTPRLIVIAKSDLCDLNKKERITKELMSSGHANIIWANLAKRNAKMTILKEANKVFRIKKGINANRGIARNNFRIIVLGVPNSGKSTLINLLAGKKVAQIANRPGVTRAYRWVNLGSIQIMDTPGILWPKFNEELIGIKLAMIGAINLEAIQLDEFSYACLKLISVYYPKKLKELNIDIIKNDVDAHNALHKLGSDKKWIIKNGEVNMNKTMKYVVNFAKELRGVTFD